MDRMAILKDQLKKKAGEINKAKFANEPMGKLRNEFAKLSREYKVLWLRDFNRNASKKDYSNTLAI